MKNIHIKKTILTLVLVILLPLSSIFAFDFGFIVNSNASYADHGSGDNVFEFNVDLWPRFSMLIGNSGELYISAGFTYGLDGNDFYYVPELMRTDITLRFGDMGFRAGRMFYSDPLSFISEGLFDGAQFFINTGFGRFSLGAWYTGFLYKKNANITMTEDDQTNFALALDYGDFFNTYFASNRLIAAFDWVHPSLAEILNLNFSVIAQMDFNRALTEHNSLYVVLKAGLPLDRFLIELGASLELSQSDPGGNNMSVAGDFGFFWTLPTPFNSRLALTAKVAGGGVQDLFTPFTPITTKYFGDVLKHSMSGLSVIGLNYTARLGQAFGTSISASYFVRNDLATYNTYPVVAGSDGYFLGCEFFGRVVWSPLSDLQLTLGGGAFLPFLGNAGSDESIKWRIDVSAIISLY